MKITFDVFKLSTRQVCVPSNDYYARGNDWSKDDVPMLAFYESFESEEKAIEYIEILAKDKVEGSFIIQKVYNL